MFKTPSSPSATLGQRHHPRIAGLTGHKSACSACSACHRVNMPEVPSHFPPILGSAHRLVPQRHWFPIASTLELDPKRPTPVRLDGLDLVVWQAGNGRQLALQMVATGSVHSTHQGFIKIYMNYLNLYIYMSFVIIFVERY